MRSSNRNTRFSSGSVLTPALLSNQFPNKSTPLVLIIDLSGLARRCALLVSLVPSCNHSLQKRSMLDRRYLLSVAVAGFRQFVEVPITPYQPLGPMGDAVSQQMPCTKNSR